MKSSSVIALFFFLHTCFFLLPVHSQIPIGQPDDSGLSNLAAAFPSLASKNGWTGAPSLDWSCVIDFDANGHILNLNIEQNGAPNSDAGFVPLQIELFRELTTLSIKNVNITADLPDNLGNLVKLQQLTIQNCYAPGPIPSLSKLIEVKEVRLDNNKFTELPADGFSMMAALQALVLNNNTINGTLNNNFLNGSTAQLQLLNLASNNFSGDLPPIFGHMTTLRSMDLSQNHFTGDIAEVLNNYPFSGPCEVNGNSFQCTGNQFYTCCQSCTTCLFNSSSSTSTTQASSSPPASTTASTTALSTTSLSTTSSSTSASLTSPTTSSSSSTTSSSTTGCTDFTCICSSDLREIIDGTITCNQGYWLIPKSAINRGTVDIATPDTVFINGSYSQNDNAQLTIHVNETNGNVPLSISGDAVLSGRLIIELIAAVPKNSITVVKAGSIQGQFSAIEVRGGTSKCTKHKTNPRYTSTEVFLTISSNCSNNNKTIIIAVTVSIGGIILVALIILVVLVMMKSRGKWNRLWWDKSKGHSKDQL